MNGKKASLILLTLAIFAANPLTGHASNNSAAAANTASQSNSACALHKLDEVYRITALYDVDNEGKIYIWGFYGHYTRDMVKIKGTSLKSFIANYLPLPARVVCIDRITTPANLSSFHIFYTK